MTHITATGDEPDARIATLDPDYLRRDEGGYNLLPLASILAKMDTIQPSPSLGPAGLLAAWGRVLTRCSLLQRFVDYPSEIGVLGVPTKAARPK